MSILTFLLTLISNISKCRTSRIEHIQKLYLFEGYDKIKEYNLTLVKTINTQEDFRYEKQGKICYLESFFEIDTLDAFYNTFSRDWIFLLDIKNEIVKLINDIDISRSKYSLSPIIIPNTLNYSFNQIISLAPIFEVDREIFYNLKAYDVKNETGNYYFVINFGKPFLNTSMRYLAGMAFVSIMISTYLLIIWRLRFNTLSSTRCLIAKNIAIFPFLKIFISMLLYYKIKLLETGKGSLVYSRKNHVHFIILTFTLVFKTLFWFFAIFISAGWELTFEVIDANHLKNFFRRYIIIYCTLCIDEFIDNMLCLQNKYFTPSDIKNFVLYLFLIITIYIRTKVTYKRLQRKIYYARFGANEYIVGLELKCSMIKRFLVAIFSFFLGYFILTYIMNVPLEFYNSPELKEINYHVLELALIASYIYIFVPLDLPEMFDAQFNDDELRLFSIVYKGNITKTVPLSFNSIFNKSAPIIITNPSYELSGSYSSLSIGFVINE